VIDGLVQTAVFGLALTLVAWTLAQLVARVAGRARPLFNPVLIASVTVIAVLLATGADYGDYMRGGSVLSNLLGPAIVALALPIHRNRRLMASAFPGLALASGVGVLIGMATTLTVGALLGAGSGTLLALASDHSTSAVAFAVVDSQGGPGSLAVLFSITAGILGAIAAPPLLRLLRVRDDRVVGFTLGSITHAIGTSRALELGELPGALAAVGMAMSAAFVSFYVPLAMLVPPVRDLLGG
jgi:putative effector of murein hydrolase